MRPLLRTGDALYVERCDETSLAVGDIAVGLRPEGHLVAHLVAATDPIRLTALLGGLDPIGTRPLGRAVEVKLRSGQHLKLPAGTRTALWAFHKTGSWLKAQSNVRAVVRASRELAYGPVTRGLRSRRIGALRVRELTPMDETAVVRFTGDNLSFPASFMWERLRTRWQDIGLAVGAVGREEQLFGFAYLDTYRAEGVDLDGHWVRGLVVARVARGLGVATGIIRELVAHPRMQQHSEIHADVLADNAPSLRAFAAAGFGPDPERTRQFTELWRRRGDQRDFTVLTFRRGS